MINAQSSLTDVAYSVCTALDRAGITVVLTGGSAATVYAPQAYQSRDCDFVITMARAGVDGNRIMHDLGYTEIGGTFRHHQNPITVEFPKGPLSVGEELIEEWNTMTRGNELLHILTPTDCCRDRLAGYYFWKDLSSLQQALTVARLHAIDKERIRTWSNKEGAADKFSTFEQLLV